MDGGGGPEGGWCGWGGWGWDQMSTHEGSKDKEEALGS